MTDEKAAITKWLDEQKDAIVVDYLPSTADAKEFLAGLRLVFLSNEDVRKATRSPAGLNNLACELRKAASWGISVNPADGFVSFYPQDGRIIAHLDASGLREKVIRDGAARECRTRPIFENDSLELEETDAGDRYSLKKALTDPGEISGFLATLTLHDGSTRCHFMTADQVRDWASRFSKKKDGGLKPLPRDNFEAYGQKTVLRQLLTKLRISGYASEELEEPETIEAAPAAVIDPSAPATAGDIREALEAEAETVDEDGVVVSPLEQDDDSDLFGEGG